MQRELILAKLTMEQVLQFYAPRKVTRHRCACPLHNGNDDNFVVYHDSFYCWVCGAGGDFIKFVSMFLNIPYPDAMRRLDADFVLGVYQKPTLSQHRKNKQQVAEYRQKQQREQQQKEEKFSQYLHFLKEYDRCQIQLRQYAPQPDDDSLHPLFAQALHNLSYINYFLDQYDWR